ncbi:phage holin family protein [Bacillus cereus]|uniref:phage holin family protein n=1 Tax=Bacillus cereus TaxID=1396 RepID=UPI0020421464|nr:phage holin family protein [Bacillus cereus]MCM3223326.1 phage holin family protein [Bacillus cereus]
MERIYSIFKGLDILGVVNDTKNKIASFISGVLGMLINAVYGEASYLWIVALAQIIILDWITGSRAAKLDGTYSSQYGIEGIARTVVLFLLPSLAHLFDVEFQLPNVFFYMVTGGLAYHIFNSFIANCARIGWDRWIPTGLLKSVASEIEAKMKRSNMRRKEIEGENE